MNKINTCLFCKIIKKEISSMQILENEHAVAILDVFPATKGHVLIITKAHYDNFIVTNDLVLASINKLAKEVSILLQKKFNNILGFNLLSNVNEIAGQTIFHTHFHVIPKYKKEEGFMFYNSKNSETHVLDLVYKQIFNNKN